MYSYSIDTALGTADFQDYDSAERYWLKLDRATLARLGPISADRPELARWTYTGPTVHASDDPHQIRSKVHGETLGTMYVDDTIPRDED